MLIPKQSYVIGGTGDRYTGTGLLVKVISYNYGYYSEIITRWLNT